ncbi:MAG: hypothetical protein K5930_07640 [Treponemataceae bacterium]|nr:hypothetical protein [Treponemataceae bacterium]
MTNHTGFRSRKSLYTKGSPAENKIIDTVLSKAAYAGKPYDPVTGLYDYGFRDYSPALAREFCEAKSREEKQSFSTFTTKDPVCAERSCDRKFILYVPSREHPIRDGLNWYNTWAASFAKQNLVEKNKVFRPDPVNFVDMWGLKQVLAEDIVQLNNNRIISNSNGNLKKQAKIEIQRSPDDNGNNGKYYQSTLSVVINDDVKLFSAPVQSTADHPNLNNGEAKYSGGTLDAGMYDGVFLNKSGSYMNAIDITGNGVEENDAVLVHPDVFTAKGETDSYSIYGKPYSLACQILKLVDFNKTINTLSNLGFRGGTPKNENESWSKGDHIKIEIKDATDKKGK